MTVKEHQTFVDTVSGESKELPSSVHHLRFKHRLAPALFHLTFIRIYLFSFNLLLVSDVKMTPCFGGFAPDP